MSCVQVLRYGKEWHNFMARPDQYKALNKQMAGRPAEGEEEEEIDL